VAWFVSVKEMASQASESLTGESHVDDELSNQVLAVAMKLNLVSALIQRGVLR
jgi:hypothetical protein